MVRIVEDFYTSHHRIVFTNGYIIAEEGPDMVMAVDLHDGNLHVESMYNGKQVVVRLVAQGNMVSLVFKTEDLMDALRGQIDRNLRVLAAYVLSAIAQEEEERKYA